MAIFNPGTKVRLTRKFLKNTAQYTGKDANGKWLIVSCDCGLCQGGNFVAVNEESIFYKDNPDMPKYRHFNTGNIEALGGN